MDNDYMDWAYLHEASSMEWIDMDEDDYEDDTGLQAEMDEALLWDI